MYFHVRRDLLSYLKEWSPNLAFHQKFPGSLKQEEDSCPEYEVLEVSATKMFLKQSSDLTIQILNVSLKYFYTTQTIHNKI